MNDPKTLSTAVNAIDAVHGKGFAFQPVGKGVVLRLLRRLGQARRRGQNAFHRRSVNNFCCHRTLQTRFFANDRESAVLARRHRIAVLSRRVLRSEKV